MNQLWTIFKRSAIYEAQFLRYNRWDFTLLFWLPLATIFLIWWIFSRPYITELPIGVIDDSHSQVSHTLTRYLEASPDLRVHAHYNNINEAYDAILAQQIYGVVIIPHDFSTAINSANPSPVVLKVNAQYGTHSGIVQRGVQTVVGTLSAGVEIKGLIKRGNSPDQASIAYSPISISRISLYNAGTNYQQFLASTVLPALLHILAMVIGATTIGRELRDHSLNIWYRCATDPSEPYPDFETIRHLPPDAKFKHATQQFSDVYVDNIDVTQTIFDTHSYTDLNTDLNTNLNNHENVPNTPPQPLKIQSKFLPLVFALNGKLIWGMLPYTLWGAVVLMLANVIHPSSTWSLIVVYVLFLLLMMISLWLGAIFSLTAYSLRMGLSTTGFVSAPSYAFAGVTFPLIAMSDGAQRWANMLPLTPYLKVQVAQLQMLAPPNMAIPYIGAFILAVASCMIVTVLMCKRAFAHPLKWGAR